MPAPIRPLVALAAIAAVEGLFMLGYAVVDVVEAVRTGTSGPADVSNVPAVLVSIVLFVLIGAGLLTVAVGWWRAQRCARAQFILAQIFAVVIGGQLATASGAVERTAGIVVALLALVGLVL